MYVTHTHTNILKSNHRKFEETSDIHELDFSFFLILNCNEDPKTHEALSSERIRWYWLEPEILIIDDVRFDSLNI